MGNTWELLKNFLFEPFAAGFQSGYMRDVDIVTAYENWWKDNMEDIEWKLENG